MDQSAEFLQQIIARAMAQLRLCCTAGTDDAEGGFTENQLRVIRLIHRMSRERETGCTVRELSETLHVTSAAVSEMVKHLAERGAVERKINPHDQRAAALTLTPQWRQKLLRADHQFNLLLSEFLGNLEERDRATIVRCAEKFYLFANQKLKTL